MINFDVLRNYMDNDEEIVHAVLHAYMEEHDTSAETIGTLYAVQDWQQLFITAHSLKGILASFGEEQTVVRLEKIESISRSHAAPDKADIEAVVKELHHIKSQISDYLAARQ